MATEKKGKSTGLGFESLNLMLIVQLIILLLLSVFITFTVSKKTRENALQHMGAISDERAHIIQNYVEQSETMLKAFAKAKPVADLLAYSTDELDRLSAGENTSPEAVAALQAAQAYTMTFGQDVIIKTTGKDTLEGLWIGSWDTHVLTHTTPKLCRTGMQTRQDAERQDALHQGMEDGDEGLYNLGIMMSPASGEQILSMYQAVYDDNGNPIGFVGLGIFTNKLVEKLDDIPIRGIENSFYSLVTIADDKGNKAYTFNQESVRIGKSIIPTQDDQDKAVKETGAEIKVGENDIALDKLCDELKGSDEEKSDSFEYKKDGKKYISIYTYMPKYGWILTIDDTTKEVFSLTRAMRFYLGLFILFILGMVVVFNIINKKHEQVNQKLLSTIAKSRMTKKSLNTAMFQDVLTGAGNRVRFATEVENAEGTPYFFALFNICNFSEINNEYGNDLGDLLLVRTVDILKELFPDAQIFRTGSDEFILQQKAGPEGMNRDEMLSIMNNVYRRLYVPEKLDNNQKVYPTYKIAIIKQSEHLNTTIISQLKAMTNKKGEAEFGMFDYKDMS